MFEIIANAIIIVMMLLLVYALYKLITLDPYKEFEDMEKELEVTNDKLYDILLTIKFKLDALELCLDEKPKKRKAKK